MIFEDGVRYGMRAIGAYRLRSGLTMLGIVIGVWSVILLTSLGEGVRQYVLSEFTQFGTNLLAVTPGKTETKGISGAIGGTTNPLTLGDAEALSRIPGVLGIVPLVTGTAEVEYQERGRSVVVYGVNEQVPEVWKFEVQQGRFLPAAGFRGGAAMVVLGPKLREEIFGDANALGERVRVGGRRFLVVGVLAPKGQFLGFDLDDAAYIPVTESMTLFNRDDLVEMDILYGNPSIAQELSSRIIKVLRARHDGEEDFTLVTQTDMLGTLDRIIRMVSLAVAGLGGISLLVGAVGILSIMWIAVRERTHEIGLIKAMGATRGQILSLFLGEAVVLSTAGGVLGLLLGLLTAGLLDLLIPGLPVQVPMGYALLALAVSFLVGVLSGLLPARKAASLDPIEALAAE